MKIVDVGTCVSKAAISSVRVNRKLTHFRAGWKSDADVSVKCRWTALLIIAGHKLQDTQAGNACSTR